MDPQEWQTRCDLAALFRVFHHLGVTDLIFTHFSARLPGNPNAFLINRYGEMFDEVTASSLAVLDMSSREANRDRTLNEAGFTIHSSVYQARPDVACVMHTHSRAGLTVAVSPAGLRPITQDALEVYDEIGYHDYGVPASADEGSLLAESCREASCLILRNHGLLTMGDTIPACFMRMYYLERACEIQVCAACMNGEPLEIEASVYEQIADRMREVRRRGDYGDLAWKSILRMLERRGDRYAV